VKEPTSARDDRLASLLLQMESDDKASYKIFATPDELSSLLLDDLMLVLSERFEESGAAQQAEADPRILPRPRPL
jgi:hypothetical protein